MLIFNMKKIGYYCAECRKVKKITQAELAEKIGKTFSAISWFEHGRIDSATILLCYMTDVFSPSDLKIFIRGILNGNFTKKN